MSTTCFPEAGGLHLTLMWTARPPTLLCRACTGVVGGGVAGADVFPTKGLPVLGSSFEKLQRQSLQVLSIETKQEPKPFYIATKCPS